MSVSATKMSMVKDEPTGGREDVSWGLVQTLFFLVSRLVFAALLLLTSAYCLLLYIPFSYFGFIHNPLLSWLPVFVRIHPYLYTVLACGVIATLLPELSDTRLRRAAWGFVALNTGVCVFLLARTPLSNMLRDLMAYVWSMLGLFPLLWLAAIDLAKSWPKEHSKGGTDRLNLSVITFAALLVSVVFGITSLLQGDTASLSNWRGFAGSIAMPWVMFGAFGAALILIRAVADRVPWAGSARLVGMCLLAWVIVAGVIRGIILPTLSFDGAQANLCAAVTGIIVVASAMGVILRLRASAAWPWRQMGSTRSSAAFFAFTALLFLAAYEIPHRIGREDWDFVLQKCAVLLVWMAVLLFLSRFDFGRAGRIVALALLCVCVGGAGVYEAVGVTRPDFKANWNTALESYAGADISFKTAYDILSRSLNNEAYAGFYRFLQQNTDLGTDVVVPPADTRLVSDLKPMPGPKPNIFIFVIDSLRQDYLSAYNPAANYAPAIGDFAKDSVVMQNAFTRYAGTALSEPAIWVGAMQLHKQYIEPFYPMNNLQKLVETEGYQSYISVDPILGQILQPSPNTVELDKNQKFWGDLDFIPTLKELQEKLAARSDTTKPIFAYTQPQNVHTLTLERSRHGGSRKEVSIYELGRMDRAFGEFVTFLKQHGLYDNSIIVLTSDHGDSYGEFGRYGHADFLFPEVIRIPLIIHLPTRMRQQFAWDASKIAFSIDITPSLYSLLGHPPEVNGEVFGRTLFARRPEELSSDSRSRYLIASSYASVYGLLGSEGKSLFIVDAVNHKNYYYDLAQDPLGVHNHVTPKIRDENEPVIRNEIEMIDRFYGYTPPSAQ